MWQILSLCENETMRRREGGRDDQGCLWRLRGFGWPGYFGTFHEGAGKAGSGEGRDADRTRTQKPPRVMRIRPKATLKKETGTGGWDERIECFVKNCVRENVFLTRGRRAEAKSLGVDGCAATYPNGTHTILSKPIYLCLTLRPARMLTLLELALSLSSDNLASRLSRNK